MLRVLYSKKFDKSLVKLVHGGLIRREEVAEIILLLRENKPVPTGYRDHALKGRMVPFRECHIRGNILLVYQIIDDELLLNVVNIGTHAQIFG